MKGLAVLPAVIIFIVAAGAIGFYAIQNGFSLTSYCSGGTALAVSQVNFQSNDPMLNKAAWLVTMNLNCAGQSIFGTVNENQIAADGKTATQGFTLTMNMRENKIRFPIQADTSTVTSGKIYTVAVYKLGVFMDRPTALNICKTQVNGGYDVVDRGIQNGWYCLQRFEQGTHGKLLEGTETFAADVTLRTENGQQGTATINNVDQTSAFLGGSLAHVQWQGGLTSGQEVPDPDNQGVCALWRFDKWSTSSCSAYTSWENQYTNFYNCVYSMALENIQQCASNVNTQTQVLLNGKEFKASGGTAATTAGSLNDGAVTLDLPKIFTFPLLTLRVDANTLGINTPVGKPDIVSVSSDKFRTGTDGTIKATVKNVGSGLGSFDVSATCNSPFSSNDRSRVSIEPNQQTDVYLKISGQATQLTTGTCTVKAIDVNNPNNLDTATVQVSVDTIIQCTPNEVRAEGRYLKKCRADGGGWDIIQTCAEGQVADPITQGCKSGTPPGGSNGCFLGICLPDFGNNILLYIILIIFGLVALFFFVLIIIAKIK